MDQGDMEAEIWEIWEIWEILMKKHIEFQRDVQISKDIDRYFEAFIDLFRYLLMFIAICMAILMDIYGYSIGYLHL